jgi:hypothetical protein
MDRRIECGDDRPVIGWRLKTELRPVTEESQGDVAVAIRSRQMLLGPRLH